jgi:hypothetical protein
LTRIGIAFSLVLLVAWASVHYSMVAPVVSQLNRHQLDLVEHWNSQPFKPLSSEPQIRSDLEKIPIRTSPTLDQVKHEGLISTIAELIYLFHTPDYSRYHDFFIARRCTLDTNQLGQLRNALHLSSKLTDDELFKHLYEISHSGWLGFSPRLSSIRLLNSTGLGSPNEQFERIYDQHQHLGLVSVFPIARRIVPASEDVKYAVVNLVVKHDLDPAYPYEIVLRWDEDIKMWNLVRMYEFCSKGLRKSGIRL